jgi:S-adenosylmethionine decarboxylase proenzyme
MTGNHGHTGSHLLLDLSGCDRRRLDDVDFITDLTERAARAAGATVLGVHWHEFSPQGVTVVAILAESHASLHTFPESGLAYWDCFTCGSGDPERSAAIVIEGLRATAHSSQIVARGKAEPTNR